MLYISTLLLLAGMAMGAVDEDLQAKYQSMPSHEFREYFNKQNYSFKITDYGNDFNPALGGHINPGNIYDFPVQRHDPHSFGDLPRNFDSREKWPQCKTIGEIYNQKKCGSCWTFGTANTASDRTCIHLNKTVHLAEQDFECQTYNVCAGGDPRQAFKFWHDKGLVTRDCKPYDVPKLMECTCHHQCVNKDIDYAKDKHYADTVYWIDSSPIDNIKAELFKNGPIQAAFDVYSDFVNYTSGIYTHKFGDYLGGHSVRVIGYGVENNEAYWLVANSWGIDWGDKGHFKIKVYDSDLGFESYLYTGIPRS